MLIDLIPEEYDASSLEIHLTNYLADYLDKIGKYSSLQPVQLKLINLNLHHCYKICKNLKLNPKQLRIFTVILFQTIIYKNPFINIINEGQAKQIEDDWKYLQQRVKQYPFITPETLTSMITEFKKYYFDNYDIFMVSFEESIQPLTKKINLTVDKPQLLPSLSTAVEKSLKPILIDSEDQDDSK